MAAPPVVTEVSDVSVLVTNVVQTTLIDATPVVVTSQVSLPVLPAITSGATTLTFNSETYTISVVDGKTTILSASVTNGKTVLVSASVLGGKTVIVSSELQDATQTLFGTSAITKTGSGSSKTETDGSTPSGSGAASNKKSGLGVGAGVGIGVGLTAALFLLGALVIFVMRRRRRKQQPHEEQELAGIVGAAADEEDGTSMVAASEDDANEKVELDGMSLRLGNRDPVELPGDSLRPQEMDGREAGSPVVSPVVSPVDVHDAQFSETLPSSRHETLSPVLSILERSNSDRQPQWPLVSSDDGVT